jgi:hypothetical protein
VYTLYKLANHTNVNDNSVEVEVAVVLELLVVVVVVVLLADERQSGGDTNMIFLDFDVHRGMHNGAAVAVPVVNDNCYNYVDDHGHVMQLCSVRILLLLMVTI